MVDARKQIELGKYLEVVKRHEPVLSVGYVTRLIGLVIEGRGPSVPIGAECHIFPATGGKPVRAEVVGFKERGVQLMALGPVHGIAPGCKIVAVKEESDFAVGDAMLGRVFNGLGEPLDGKPFPFGDTPMKLYADPINPLIRKRITEPLDLGVRAINTLIAAGKGQRLGIMAGTGVGKSVLMGMMAKFTSADVNVIALIGERSREINDFVFKNLGEEGLKRSVIVVATSSDPPVVRVRAAFLAMCIAEYFREKDKNVLFLMDSLTRLSMAQREIGLSIGEPPTTKGYTPSVFALLPRFLERAGRSASEGSITALCTVLVEGDDLADPIADASRAILDGHIILSRAIASKNHYPAIDVLNSISRVMIDVVTPEHRSLAGKLRETMAVYRDAEDLINIGAYVKGTNTQIDYAIDHMNSINKLLQQDIDERSDMAASVTALRNTIGK